MPIKEKINKLLFETINPLVLGFFRIVFGVFALLESLYFYHVHLIEDYILQPKVLFNYHFLPVTPFSETILQLILVAIIISSILIITGLFYRVATIVFFLGFTYFFLLDKSYYNNHIYLISLVSLFLIFIPANNSLTLFKNKKPTPTLGWHLRLLQFQFVVVYFFGGIAKLNGDWLIHHEPMSSFLKVGGYYSEALTVFLVYGGVAFDLCIGFLLLIKKTRLFALVGVIIFNVSNHFIFDDINIFPFFMLSSVVVFFDVHRWKFLSKYNTYQEEKTTAINSNKLVGAVLGIYFVIQILMPFRHLLYEGNVDWTGEGQRFAWRMKIQSRGINECKFAIFDLDAKKIYPVDMSKHIHEVQRLQMVYDPKMVIDYAHFLGEDAKKNHGLKNVMVKARIDITFNQRKSIDLVSPDTDLMKEEWSFAHHNKWIAPLTD